MQNLVSLIDKEVIIHGSQPYEIKGLLARISNDQFEVTDLFLNEQVGFWNDSILFIDGNHIYFKIRN